MKERELNRYAEMTLVASYLRTTYNKIASMDIMSLPDNVCEKIQVCLAAMEDTAMNIANEKLKILEKVRQENG